MVATLCLGKLKDIFRKVRLIVEGIEKILIRTVEDAGPYGINLVGQVESDSFYSVKVDIIGAKRPLTPHSTLHSPHSLSTLHSSLSTLKE